MSIRVNKAKRIFTIDTNNTSYQMQADPHGVLLHLYYGPKTAGEADMLLDYRDRGYAGQPYDLGNDRTYSLDALPQEYPTFGTGDFRSPALAVEAPNGYAGCDLRYRDYEIHEGKYSIPGLPAAYAGDEETQTLVITLEDAATGIRAELLYGVFPEEDVITRAVTLINTGAESFYITKALSANVDFTGGNYDILSFYGRHGMERNLQRSEAGHGEFRIGSRRGMSSHQYNPLLVLADHETTERSGLCFAMEFVYSGGFEASVEKDQFSSTRMQMGLSTHLFRYPLKAGMVFAAPEVLMSCSREGLNRLSQNLAKCIREHICRGPWRDRVRPVLLNSWEGCYFHFDGQKIRDLAREAKDLGMDMLVLDDGWFGKRDDDNSGLGDWYVNEKKLGGSLRSIADDVHGMGLLFGLWVEPEMVSEDSDLYRAHPEWALREDHHSPVRGRNQLVLDFSDPEVVDTVYKMVSGVIRDARIDYLKWDFNRSISDVFSHVTRDQGTVLYDYIIGLYRFLEQLNADFPDLLIEGCSGGGGRFDAGMLCYTPQIWCSDDTDAVSRLRIQYGTSFGYPASAVGAHVSAVPNEQCGRVTSMRTRSVVAMSGTYGFELDPAKLSEAERNEIRREIEIRNRCAELFMKGRYFRLTDPFTDPVAAWMSVAEDGTRSLVSAVALETHCNMPQQYVRLQGLLPGRLYKVRNLDPAIPEFTTSAEVLETVGLMVPWKFGEYLAWQWELALVETSSQYLTDRHS